MRGRKNRPNKPNVSDTAITPRLRIGSPLRGGTDRGALHLVCSSSLLCLLRFRGAFCTCYFLFDDWLRFFEMGGILHALSAGIYPMPFHYYFQRYQFYRKHRLESR